MKLKNLLFYQNKHGTYIQIPKKNWNEAYNTASSIVDDCLKIKNFERAKNGLINDYS